MLFSLELYNWNSEDFNLEGGQYPIKSIIFPAFISSRKVSEELFYFTRVRSFLYISNFPFLLRLFFTTPRGKIQELCKGPKQDLGKLCNLWAELWLFWCFVVIAMKKGPFSCNINGDFVYEMYWLLECSEYQHWLSVIHYRNLRSLKKLNILLAKVLKVTYFGWNTTAVFLYDFFDGLCHVQLSHVLTSIFFRVSQNDTTFEMFSSKGRFWC